MPTCAVVERGRILRDSDLTQPDSSDVSRLRLPAVLYDRLLKAESQRRKQEDPVFEWSYNQATVGPWVGVLRVPGLQLELLPKIAREDGTDLGADQARKNLLRMLTWAGAVPMRQRDVAALETRKAPLHEILSQLFCRRLQEELLRGMDRSYLVQEERLKTMRGRLMVADQARHGRPDRLSCHYEEFLEDTVLNRIFRAACEGLARVDAFQDEVRRCLLLLEDVSSVADPLPLLEKVVLNRQNERFADVLGLARLILLGLSPTVRAGAVESFALLFNMDRVFEGFIAGFYRSVVLPGTAIQLRPQSKGQAHYLLQGDEHPHRALHLKPDLLFELGDQRVVMDTKWKQLGVRSMPSNADLYQLYAYTHHFQSPQSFLLYPGRRSGWSLPSMGPDAVTPRKVGVRFVSMDHDLSSSEGRDALKQSLKALVEEAFGERHDGGSPSQT